MKSDTSQTPARLMILVAKEILPYFLCQQFLFLKIAARSRDTYWRNGVMLIDHSSSATPIISWFSSLKWNSLKYLNWMAVIFNLNVHVVNFAKCKESAGFLLSIFVKLIMIWRYWYWYEGKYSDMAFIAFYMAFIYSIFFFFTGHNPIYCWTFYLLCTCYFIVRISRSEYPAEH